METGPECIPCLLRHTRDLARNNLPGPDREIFYEAVMDLLARFDRKNPPPLFAGEMYRVLERMAGIPDPYAEQKASSNRRALALVPTLEKVISSSSDPVEAAMRIAVAGNIVDFGVHDAPDCGLEETVERALRTPFAVDCTAELLPRLRGGGSVLYIGDNAGEIVLDRLFIQRISPARVTFAVRSAPIINDATLPDARQAGLTGVCEVVESGSPVSGTPLELCTEEFRELFFSCGTVISKGQGNFETLSGSGREVFHLLVAKCPVIASRTGAPLGSFIALKEG